VKLQTPVARLTIQQKRVIMGKCTQGKSETAGDDGLHSLNGVKQTVRSDYLHAHVDYDMT